MQADDMKIRLQTAKLIELRAKTDRQLFELINRRVDAGLAFVRLATESGHQSQWTADQIFRASACRAYTEASRLLPLIDSPSRLRVEFKLEQLRRGLGAVSNCAKLQAQTA